MEKSKLIFWRNFLAHTLIISLIISLLMFGFFYTMWNSWVPLLKYMHVDEFAVATIALILFSLIKVYLVFFLLCPLIALQLMISRKRVD